MGYALWVDGELAYAEGTHEYRAWGSAVVGIRTQFRLKDFRPRHGKRPRQGKEFIGLFPSLEEVNIYLRVRKTTESQMRRTHRDARRMLAILGGAETSTPEDRPVRKHAASPEQR
jgi:hypothetical protein